MEITNNITIGKILKKGEREMKKNLNDKYQEEQKIDAVAVAKEMEKLSPEEKEKIYYMVKGIALVSEAPKQATM